MSTLIITLFQLCTVIFEIHFIRLYIDSLKTQKPKHKLRHIAWVVFFLFQCWIAANDTGYSVFNTIVNSLLFIFILLSNCGMRFLPSLYHCIFFFVIRSLIAAAVFFILSSVGLWDYEYGSLALSSISKIFMYLVIQIILRYRRDAADYQLPLKQWLRLIFIPASTVFMVFYIFMISYETSESLYFVVITILLFIINYIVFNASEGLSLQMETERSNLAYIQQIEWCSKQAAEREAAYQETRTLRHALNEYLLDLKLALDNGNVVEAEAKVNYILHKNTIYRGDISKSGNLVVDSLINHKYALAQKYNIKIDCNILIPQNLPYDSGDLCIILGNLLDNAIEASIHVPDNRRSIIISMAQMKGNLSIKIQNNYNSSLKKAEQSKNDSLKTTGEDSSNHGLGLLSVQKAVNKYHGLLSFHHDETTFKAAVLLYAP